ncbi:IS66 family insertion sequence element accessory protein TnpB [Pseudorhodobacter turbinis]|uniref:IS66 family insertion sequence element accessory protein TnpB n=1 Tax=Pseudorhodobacter turbinis TaxID=2500533 RepID=A0A4P8EDT3_9RHOB|nr:transposase [Pseudorhodobacter turbinis]QCO54535.1 IS66 family insertion sequence element accessory protein TnpB [Pseudorhodobacter turbinis]
MRHEVIVGVERRRRWRAEEKLSILDEVGLNGATVSDVARRHDITRQHIYQWRQEFRRKGLWPRSAETVFLSLPPPPCEGPSRPADSQRPEVEIMLGNGRSLRCVSDLSPERLQHLIRAVETA